MAQTFSDRIEGFVGTLTMSSVDMEDVLAEEARILYDLATPDMLAKESIYDVRTDSTIGTFTVEDKRIVSVLRNDGSYDRPCAEVAFEMLGPMGDSASIQYASKRDPVFALQPKQNLGATERSTGIQVQPAPTATETLKIRYVAYPTSVYGATADNLPDFLRKIANPLVYRGCSAEIASRIQASIADLAAAFYDVTGLTPPTSPIANLPAAPLLTYTDVISSTYTDVDAALDEVDTIIQDLASSSITLPILSTSYADFNTAMANGDIELAQSYLSRIQAELSEYQSESQAIISEFTALNAKRYDSSISHAVNKVDAYLKRLQDIASRADSVALQNEAKGLEKQVSEYRFELERFGAEIQTYGQELQSYGLQLQSKVSEANDKMQRKTLEIQSLTADRQYYEGLYAQELQKLGVVQANG
jgi:hypothetical protein